MFDKIFDVAVACTMSVLLPCALLDVGSNIETIVRVVERIFLQWSMVPQWSIFLQ